MKMPKNRIDQDELASFFEAVKDVKRLTHNKIVPESQKPKKKPEKILVKKREASFYFEEDHNASPVSQEDYLIFKQSSISDKLLRKLKKGQYNVQAIIDLHGLTVSEAEIELSCFLTECAVQSIKVVLLIHGKGKNPGTPVLKNKLNQWLRHYKNVLAFCTALPRHGGKGAVYVLLKSL
jgi:DNA-nicking Smr family endonuclease